MRKVALAIAAVLLGGAISVAVPQLVHAQATAGADQSATAQTGKITGKVVDSSGNPVSGAIVHVMQVPTRGDKGHKHGKHGNRGGNMNNLQPGQTVWHTMVTGTTKTADDGTFTINNAPVGSYRIMVMDRKVGNGHNKAPVDVGAGASADAGTITLQKGRGGRHHKAPAQ